jgi:hypothetical protein
MVHVNNEIPSQSNENIYIKSDSIWIYNQQKNYKNNKQIMSNPEIRKLWESFKNDSKYNRYFLSNEEEWNTIKDHQHMIKIKILKVIYFSSTFIFIDLFFLFDSVNSLSC